MWKPEWKKTTTSKKDFTGFKEVQENFRREILQTKTNIQPFPSLCSLWFLSWVCARAQWAASRTVRTLSVSPGVSASVRSVVFHTQPCASTADPDVEETREPAPTSLSVWNADVNGRYGRVGVVAVVLDEVGVLLPGLLYHRHWSNAGRRSPIR